MKKPLNKDLYREMKYGKKELTIISVVVVILSLALIGAGVLVIIRGALNPNGAWQIIWRVLLGVVSLIIGGVLLGVGVTMFTVTKTMIKIDEGNVSDVEKAEKVKPNLCECKKCGAKLKNNAKYCKLCEKGVKKKD